MYYSVSNLSITLPQFFVSSGSSGNIKRLGETRRKGEDPPPPETCTFHSNDNTTGRTLIMLRRYYRVYISMPRAANNAEKKKKKRNIKVIYWKRQRQAEQVYCLLCAVLPLSFGYFYIHTRPLSLSPAQFPTHAELPLFFFWVIFLKTREMRKKKGGKT
jgi:hypothetical protein